MNINKKTIETKLKKLGAKKIFDDKVLTIGFCFPNEDQKNLNRVVRLRKLGKENVLTVKTKIHSKEMKIRDEFEVKVSDFKTAEQIISALGLKEFTRSIKHRISYSLDKVHFDIDTYVGKKPLLEIESQKKEFVKKYVELLGYKMKDTVLFAYSEKPKK